MLPWKRKRLNLNSSLLSAGWATVSLGGVAGGFAAVAGGAVSAGLGVFAVAGFGAGLGVATGAAVVGLALGVGGGSRGNCTQSLLLAAAAALAGRGGVGLSVVDPVALAGGAESAGVTAAADLLGRAGKRIQSAFGNTTPEASRLAPKSLAVCASTVWASSIPAGSSRHTAPLPSQKTFESSLFSMECMNSDT